MKNRNENGNENRNVNVDVSSIVYEVIRTILFFFTRKFYKHKKHKKTHINKQKLKKTSKEKVLCFAHKKHLRRKSLV